MEKVTNIDNSITQPASPTPVSPAPVTPKNNIEINTTNNNVNNLLPSNETSLIPDNSINNNLMPLLPSVEAAPNTGVSTTEKNIVSIIPQNINTIENKANTLPASPLNPAINVNENK